MKDLFWYIVEFISAYLLVVLYYHIFVLKKGKSSSKQKDFVEIRLFLALTKLKTSSKMQLSLMKALIHVNAFDVACILLLTELSENGIVKALIALIFVFPIVCLSYRLLGVYYHKRGMMKNV